MKSTSDCEQLQELIPAYSIGATDDDETRAIEIGLRECPELAAELERFQALNRALASSVVQVVPPPQALASLLDAAKTSRRPLRRRPARWLAAAACLALILIANNLYWAARINAVAGREIPLPTGQGGLETNANGRLIWNPNDGNAVLIAADFPELTPDAGYQAWVQRADVITSLGVFQVDERGAGVLVFSSSLLAAPFDSVGVTTEQLEGSPSPTSPPVVRWRAF